MAALSEILTHRSIARMGWTKPLCPWHLPELCGLSAVSKAISVHRSTMPLLGFRLHRRSNQTELAGRTSAPDSSHGLSFPSAHTAWEIHSSRVLPARCVPPSGFGYPLDGFLPPGPCQPCFMPAALLGFSLRSVSLSQGASAVSSSADPRTVPPGTPPPARRQVAAVPSRGSRALSLPRVPCDRTWV
jgi:hypothetical protein